MVDEAKQYEFITGQLTYYNEKIIEAFNLFVKLITAIFAGSIWLSVQQIEENLKLLANRVTPWLLVVVGMSTSLLILINLRAWWGYRRAVTSFVGVEKAPPPEFPRSCSSELVMLVVIVVSTLMGIFFIHF